MNCNQCILSVNYRYRLRKWNMAEDNHMISLFRKSIFTMHCRSSAKLKQKQNWKISQCVKNIAMDAAFTSRHSVLFEIVSLEYCIKWMRLALFKTRESKIFAKLRMTTFSAHMQKLAAHTKTIVHLKFVAYRAASIQLYHESEFIHFAHTRLIYYIYLAIFHKTIQITRYFIIYGCEMHCEFIFQSFISFHMVSPYVIFGEWMRNAYIQKR